MNVDEAVARHYTQSDLTSRILSALIQAGKNLDMLSSNDLAEIDEFHLGWAPQTAEFASQLDLTAEMDVLDIGSGLGGPARYFAEMHSCNVTGIDLTAAFVALAKQLTTQAALADRVKFVKASALAMPFDAASFDRATLIHVGMNIADKEGLFREVRRVLQPGGRFGVYDVMRIGAGELPMPMPWADSEATSFVETPEIYRALLEAAGFQVTHQRDRTGFVLALVAKMRERIAVEGTPVLGLHLVIGPTARERAGRLISCLEREQLAPIELIATAV